MTKHYLTMKAVQEKLHGRSRTSIYNDFLNGRIPQPIKLGGRLYWEESALDAALEAQINKLDKDHV